jgi:regulation of enolase protein 1 (concanavalin A-like superfamily)
MKPGTVSSRKILGFSIAAALSLLFSTFAAAQVDVLTQHNDTGRTGQNLNETVLTTSNVNVNTFGKLFARMVDGQIYAQPLYLSDLNVQGVTRNVVYAATMHNSVYAFDADDPAASAPLWHVNLGTSVPATDVCPSCGYVDITPEIGILGTPVIDAAGGTIYVVAKTKNTSNTTYHFTLHALDVITGAEKFGGPAEITGQVSGTGAGGSNGTITFAPLYHLNRPALLLLNGVVYIAFGSLGDIPPYHGWIFGYNATSLQQTAIYNTTPNGSNGAIWQSGQGLMADQNGSIYFMTGNGSFTANNSGSDYGDSFVKLSTPGLSALDYFTPSNQGTLNSQDLDLGSGGPMLLPGTSMMVGAGKDGILRLLDTTNLGHFSSTSDNDLQEFKATNGTEFIGTSIYWNSPNNGPVLYIWGAGDRLKAFRFTAGRFQTPAVLQGSITEVDGGSSSVPLSLSANGSSSVSGIIWGNAAFSQDPNHATVAGILRAFDATTLTEVWNSRQNAARDDSGSYAKFASATVANGKVYEPTFSGQLLVYGLLSQVNITAPAAGASFAAPANITITASAGAPAGATVTSVDFFAGTTLLGSDTAAPYSFNWTSVAAGNYSLTVRANYSQGLPVTSAPVAITVTNSTLPSPWVTQDIGSVALAGSAGFMNGTFSITGSGTDIYGTSDDFRYVYQTLTGDGQIIARVASLQNTDPWSKAGLMIRETLSANATNAMIEITPGNGGNFQRRVTTGGTSASTGPSAGIAPYWVKLVRSGNTFSGYVSPDGANWVLVGSNTINMASSVFVGLALTSHSTNALCTATLDGVSVTAGSVQPTVSLTAPANGATYSAPANVPITAQASPGTGASVSQVAFYSGTTLIGTALTSPYSITWSNVAAGSYSLTATVTDSLGGTTSSSPVGITVGGGTSLPSPWTSQDVGNVALAGSASFLNGTFTLSGSGADIWLAADAFRFAYQTMTGDGQIVARVASLQNTNVWAKGGVMIRDTLAAGSANAFMALTPGNGANFQRRLSAGAASVKTGPSAATAPFWVKLVRSGNLFTGYASADGVNWTLVGSDTITMGSTVFVGLALTSHNDAALCTATFDGVAITAGSAVLPTVSITAPANGASFSAPATFAITATATASSGASVSRVDFYSGATLLGSSTTSPYSFTWSNVAAGSYQVTAIVTDSTGANATSSQVGITVTSGGLPSPWLTQDIGVVGVAGSAAFATGTFTIRGAGYDIWGTTDAFRYVYHPLTGDGQIVARVATLQNTNVWAKGGVMIRETLTAGSSYAMMLVTPGSGSAFQRRLATGATYLHNAGPNVVAPYWVRLVRSGNTITGYVSSDGVNWTQVGSDTFSMASTVYIGLAVTSHNSAALCTATMDNVQ